MCGIMHGGVVKTRQQALYFIVNHMNIRMYTFQPAISNCFIFSLQVKNSPHDGVAICVFILIQGIITNTYVYPVRYFCSIFCHI